MIVPILNRFLQWMVVGVISPILVLLILSKGVDLSGVGLVVGISSACVFLFEIPSGILADLWGRKAVYLVSLAIQLLALAVMFSCRDFIGMAAGFALFGIARAFSSGSIESDFIDRRIETHGEEGLHSLMVGMGAGETAGLALGAALGGIVPMAWARMTDGENPYGGNLAVQAALVLTLLVITLVFLPGRGAHKAESFKPFARSIAGAFRSSPALRALTAGASAWGFSFFAVETYWQPRLRDILGSAEQSWVFGTVGAAYFGFAIGGTALAGLAGPLFRKAPFAWIAAFRALTGAAIAALAARGSLSCFLPPFFLIMGLNGAAGVSESAAINTIVDAKTRSTMLSIGSFAMQLGGVVGAGTFSFLLRTRSIGFAWTVAGAVFALSSLLYLALYARASRPERQPDSSGRGDEQP